MKWNYGGWCLWWSHQCLTPVGNQRERSGHLIIEIPCIQMNQIQANSPHALCYFHNSLLSCQAALKFSGEEAIYWFLKVQTCSVIGRRQQALNYVIAILQKNNCPQNWRRLYFHSSEPSLDFLLFLFPHSYLVIAQWKSNRSTFFLGKCFP